MHTALYQLIEDNKIGFEDIFDAYAELCIQSVREVTEDVILDEGANALDLSIEGLTNQAVDWALIVVPEMVGGDLTESKRDNESWLEYVIRVSVTTRIEKTNALRVKLS